MYACMYVYIYICEIIGNDRGIIMGRYKVRLLRYNSFTKVYTKSNPFFILS